MKTARHGAGRYARRMVSDVVGALLAVVIFGAAAARAQAPAPTPLPQTNGQGASGDLSHQLDQSKGVISPKQDVDPGIQVTPPESGSHTMPVIPPPGSPGGDQQVQPK